MTIEENIADAVACLKHALEHTHPGERSTGWAWVRTRAIDVVDTLTMAQNQGHAVDPDDIVSALAIRDMAYLVDCLIFCPPR